MITSSFVEGDNISEPPDDWDKKVEALAHSSNIADGVFELQHIGEAYEYDG